MMSHLWKMGYAAEDIVGNIFRVCKTHSMAEYLKLEFIKVLNNRFTSRSSWIDQFFWSLKFRNFILPLLHFMDYIFVPN